MLDFPCLLYGTKSVVSVLQKGRLYLSSCRVCYESPGSTTSNEQINIRFDKIKALKEYGTKGLTLETIDGKEVL
jgi:hypothetical protein